MGADDDVTRGGQIQPGLAPRPSAHHTVALRPGPADATQRLPAVAFARPDPRSVTPPPPAAHAAPQPLDFHQNQEIGRFGLIRELARGGMGQVFLARDTKLGRKVAIKFLLHDDPTFVQRFVVEARATARCTHENIVTIFEVGEHAGLPYMVLEFLEGKTLSDVLAGHPSARQFAELMVPVASALERAHEHGIVHRDLKPSNVFVTDRGQVKVLDFGVARILDRTSAYTEQRDAIDPSLIDLRGGETSVTFTGNNSLVGTLPYMSPEQWGADEVDHQSDLWALGIMFWRALTGVHPAGTTAPEKLRDRMRDLDTPLPSIGTRDPAIPRPLVAIVDRLLAKRKGFRYASATDVLADLRAFLAPHEIRGDDATPYRGLAAFDEADAKYFFGRSNEIRTALSQLDAWPLLAVIGPSGVGKSSFVHAGLIPAMRASGETWQVRVVRPGRAPLQRLATILDDALQTGQPATDLIAQLVEAPGTFGLLLRQAAARKGHRVVVVVDQLEELFTLCDDDAQRRVFLAALLAAADDPSSPARVVLSMRADFLDRLAHHKQFFADLTRGLFFLTAPDHENLREALVRPAELAGYAFEDAGIIEAMMDAATTGGALPLLSFAASRLWDARDRDRKLLTRAAYEQMGGVGGAFARHADQVAAAVPAQAQPLLRAVMTRLVTPEGTRAVVDHAELLSLAAPADVEQIVDQLVRGRLVHLHTDPDHGATVEIVHEMLITEWPTLRRWLDDSQAMRGFVHELRAAARQWAARGKPADLLWRGATATEALANVRRHVLDLAAGETEFLAAVRGQIARARRRKVLAIAAALGVLALVLVGGAVAVVKISAAEGVAQQKALVADESARIAREAQAEVQRQLDAVNSAKAAKATAEDAKAKAEAVVKDEATKVKQAEGEVTQSREELEQRNADLRHALADAQQEKQRAQASAEIAKKATDEAKAAKAAVEASLASERERVKQLEAEKKKIYDRPLN